MGFFSGVKGEMAGRKAYMRHVDGNRLSDAGKPEEARVKHEEAVRLYEQAVEMGCRKPAYLMAYGVLLLRMRDYQKAHDVFLLAERQPAITKDERRQLRINYAIAQWKMGSLDSAIEQLKIASADGSTSMIYGSLGFMLIAKAIQTGDFSEALAYNQEALEYDDEDAVILDNLGQLYLNMGDREKALEHFTKAHEIKPSQVDTLYYLAKIAQEDGDPDKAREYLDDALNGNFSALCTVSRDDAQSFRNQLG